MGRTSEQTWGMSWIHGGETFSVLISRCVTGFLSIPEFLQVEQPVVSNCAVYNILICGFKNKTKQGLAEILHQKFSDADVEERHHAYLKPFRVLVSLLDKPEIGNVRSAVTIMSPMWIACARHISMLFWV